MNRKQRRAAARGRPSPKPRRPQPGVDRPGGRATAVRWVEHGRRLQSDGRTAEAVGAFRNAVAACPEAAEIHGILGSALRAAGDLAGAIAALRLAVELDPNIPALHNNLGNAYVDFGAADKAVAAYRIAVSLDPDYADAHGNLGLALRDAGQFDDAVSACRRALGLAPERPDLHGNLAAVLENAGRPTEADAVLDTAIGQHPDAADLRCQRARLLIKAGDMAAAESVLREALKVDPDCAAAYFELSDIKRFDAEDEDLRAMEALSASVGGRPLRDRIDLHFALAKAYEDAGRYDNAFDQLQHGNRLQRRRLPYDAEGQSRLFETMTAVFDAKLVGRLNGCGEPSALPVFVVGMPRSGTTLVERILGSHPQAHGAGELPILSEIARRASGAGDPIGAAAGLARLSPEQCRSMGRDYVARVRALAPDATRIVDKMPSNFLRVGLIGVILPNAPIIHCRRDPADTCLSCFAQLFGQGQSFSYDLRDLGRYYTLYRRLMAHWRSVLPGRVLDVDYEALVADPEAQARRLLDHCGLPWDPACLQFHTDRSPVRTASAAQVRRPIYKSSVARWRRFEAHLGPLLEALGENR